MPPGYSYTRLSPHSGNYRYTPDLLKLSAVVRLDRTQNAPKLMHIGSPLLPCIAAWHTGLLDRPNREFAGYTTDGEYLSGVQGGF